MASESVSALTAPEGLYFDELSKIRLVSPEQQEETEQLRTECREFLDRINRFQGIVGGMVTMMDRLAAGVEKEKMEAIGSRNMLKSAAKQREVDQKQLQAQITEKEAHLARLQVQYESYLKQQQEQESFIESFVLQK